MTGPDGIPVDLPVRTPTPAPGEVDAPLVSAILHEIADHLEILAREGIGNSLDLRSLPLTDGDRTQLLSVLGTGEVQARIEAFGPSEIVETAVPGVWWITHRDEAGRIAAELLEITTCPEILGATTDDVQDGLEALRRRLAAQPPESSPVNGAQHHEP